MEADIYPPSEDTFLLWDAVKRRINPGESVLEIGTGSGFIAKKLQEMGANVTATDINPHVRIEGIKFIRSDLFENIDESYDAIVFNPPYLPDDSQGGKWNRAATIGGEKGHETIERFLAQAKNHGKRIYIAFSSLTGDIKKIAKRLGYSFEIISEKKLFFEKIFAAELISLKKS